MQTINFRYVLGLVGHMCLVESGTMLLGICVALYYGEDWTPMAVGMLSSLLLGGLLKWYGEGRKSNRSSRREGMLTVTMTWGVISLLGVIPLMLSGSTTSLIDAWTECVSGFTTTGSTVFPTVEQLPHSILFFRSLMQWQGGIGIVVFAVAILPIVNGGVNQLYNAETTGITHDRFLPRIKDIAKRLSYLYVGETTLLALLLYLGPMDGFDSVCHALTCMSTGGFSTKDAGIQAYGSAYVEYLLTIFMYIGSLNLGLLYFAVTGRRSKLFKDEEFRWFTAFVFVLGAITTGWLYIKGIYPTVEECFRKAFFHIISLGSSTGYLTDDITLWQSFFWMIALLAMFVNGCAGSTSGGLKMSRFIVLVKNLYNEFKKQIHPHLVTPVIINGKRMQISTVHQILAFCVLYILLIFVGGTLLMLDGNDFVSSISLACSAISNSGPSIGPNVFHIQGIGDFSKLVITFLMIAGRLEVFTVIGIFTPYFWRR